MRLPEHLIIRGRLNAADEFVPRRCRSSRYIRPRQYRPDGDLIVETTDREGQPVRSAIASVRSDVVCAPGIETWRVEGIVVLDDRASAVRLRRGERIIWSAEVAEKPELRIKLRTRPRRGGGRRTTESCDFPGGRPAVLNFAVSDAAEGLAPHVVVVHQWGEGLFRTVYVGAVAGSLKIPADSLPGGTRCRFVAIYSNGMRSVAATTDWYELEPIGPIVRIDSPTGKERLLEGATLSLSGYVEIPEDPGTMKYADRLIWLMDGRAIGSGPQVSILHLCAGRHEIALVYQEPGRPPARRAVRVRVKASQHASADEWEPWDHFAVLDQ